MTAKRQKRTASGRGSGLVRARLGIAVRGRCSSCHAHLASDQKGPLCSACQESGRGLRDDERIVDFALDLYPLRQTLGVLGLDYILYHHFFNQALQERLRELRQRLYHQPEPPRPLSLGNAAAWAARIETEDGRRDGLFRRSAIDQVITETSPEIGTAGLLLRGFDPPRWRRSLEQHAGGVSEELRELEETLPAAIGTLHLALVCGTPPLPPGVRASSELRRVPQVGVVPAFSFKVFSAKERDIRTAYEELLGGRFNYVKKDFFPIGSAWQARGPLPFLEIVCVPYKGTVPTAAAVQRFFKNARTPVSRFFDGSIRAKDYGYALRAWAILALVEERGMSSRDALIFWNERAPRGLSYGLTPTVRKTQTGQSTLSQELARLRRRIARWRGA